MSVLASLGDQLPLCEVDLTTTFGTLGNHRGDSLLGRFLYNRADHTPHLHVVRSRERAC
jgi:hypothetical protein